MTENRPYRPFAANIQEMQRTFFVQTGICRIRILQNLVVENSFLGWSDNLGQFSLTRKIKISVMQKPSTIEVEFSREPSGEAFAVRAQPTWIQYGR